jgi:hypothetical protein
MTRRRFAIALSVLMLVATAATPAQAAPPDTEEFARTECVIATGPPRVVETTGQALHIRDFPYLGLLTDGDGTPTGTNSGFVDIDLNLKEGTGSIRGSLTVRDAFMGDFDGKFSAHYQDFAWQGRGVAKGVGDDAGKLLTMWVDGLVPSDVCGSPPIPGLDWSDAAAWDVLITDL